MPFNLGQVLGGIGSSGRSGVLQGRYPPNPAQQATQQQYHQPTTASAWVTLNNTTTGTATTFNVYTNGFASNTTASSVATVQQASWEDPSEYLAEQLLERKLRQGRQLLLSWSRHPLPRKFNFIGEHAPVLPMDMRTVEGYRLPEDKLYVLPDGSKLALDSQGNYGIFDEDAKVVYKANRIREFNPYLNASDLLVSFIKEVGHLDGVNQDEILRLPVEAFINWLVLQAATKDGDATNHLPKVEDALTPRALPAPKPDQVHHEIDLERDCLVVKEVFIKRIPRALLEDRVK